MTTPTRPGFTKDQTNASAPCCGINHTDSGVIGRCDGCGVEVARRADDGVFTIQLRGSYNARKISCWAGPHKCDPAKVEVHQDNVARWLSEGEIMKGQTVTVVKGRKVPKGTTGQVFWVGDNDFGRAVGIRTAEGVKHFTAASNVQAN